jgi:hypothetical protein
MIYLISRPFTWLFKIVKGAVKAPFKAVVGVRDHRGRKNAKIAAQAVKRGDL